MNTMFYSSAPARVCLYGEHQDYLQLNVIPAAINLRLSIKSRFSSKNKIIIHSRDLNQTTAISTTINTLRNKIGSLESYLEAGIIALKNLNPDMKIPALNISIESQIPIASGLSSSAALLVGWIQHISGIMELDFDKSHIAELAYDAEHNILGIPCGKMDQYACSYGNIIRLSSIEPPEVVKLNIPEVNLIVVDSQTPKLTSDVHGRKVKKIKETVNRFEILAKVDLRDISMEILTKKRLELSNSDFNILQGIISIKECTEIAEKELSKSKPDICLLGELLTTQHKALKEKIEVSLPILDKIVEESISLGALGGKLTGAGLGGSVVIMTQNNTEKIAENLKKNLGLPVKVVEIDEGANFEII